jgi:hypothetical protein
MDRENSWFVHQSSVAILQVESSGNKTGGMSKGNDEFGLAKYFCSSVQMIFTCRKILRHGASGFTSLPKEDMLRISVALNKPLPRLGLNTRTLGPMEKTPAITPPRLLRETLLPLLLSGASAESIITFD